MFNWRQHRDEADCQRLNHTRCRDQGRTTGRFLLGTVLGLALLALPLWAQDVSPEARDAGLNARGQAFWEARIKEDYAAQYGLFEPKVRQTLSLTDYIKGQGPVQYLEAHIDGVKIDE